MFGFDTYFTTFVARRTEVNHSRPPLSYATVVQPSASCLLRCSEVAFYCLDAIHPVTHAVANTVKRVFLIAVSIVVFGHKLTPLGSIGSAVAIGGVLLYSLAKQKFPNKK